jgi:hypothetical protein
MFGVETNSFLPHDQSDRGDLAVSGSRQLIATGSKDWRAFITTCSVLNRASSTRMIHTDKDQETLN